jgi:hypothetical protein
MGGTSTALVVPLPSRREVAPLPDKDLHRASFAPPRFGPIDNMLIVIGDRELDTYARLYAISPLRQAMTFEGYLAARGFAHWISKSAR